MATTITVDKGSEGAVVGTIRKSARIPIALVLLGLALGGGALELTRQSDLEAGRAELEVAHWPVVSHYKSHYESQYEALTTPAERDNAYWRAVLAYYEAKYGALTDPVRRDAAHWLAVVD